MKDASYVWQGDGLWLGYLEEFPDYMTQGESMAGGMIGIRIPGQNSEPVSRHRK